MTNAEKQAAWRKRQKDKGLVRVVVYVPPERVNEIKEAAKSPA